VRAKNGDLKFTTPSSSLIGQLGYTGIQQLNRARSVAGFLGDERQLARVLKVRVVPVLLRPLRANAQRPGLLYRYPITPASW